MKLRITTYVFLLIIMFISPLSADEIILYLQFRNSKEQSIAIPDTTDEIRNFKIYFYSYLNQEITKTAKHSSSINSITGLEKLPNLRKIQFIYSFSNVQNLNFLSSESLETLFVSSGLVLNDLSFIDNTPNLRILGFNWIRIDLNEMDLRNIPLEYLELSEIESTSMPIIKLPHSIQVINLSDSKKLNDNLDFLEIPEGKSIVYNTVDNDPNTVSILFNHRSLYSSHPEYIMDRP